MLRSVAVAINTFRETVRDRILFVVLGAGVFLLLSTLALGELSFNEERRVIIDLGLASISWISILTTIFLGSSLLHKEIDRKTLYVVLPKPIRRSEFLAGKYLGIVFTLSVLVAVLGSMHLWVLHLQLASSIWLAIAVITGSIVLLGTSIYLLRDPMLIWIPWSAAFLATSLATSQVGFFDKLIVSTSYLLTLGEVLLLTSVSMLFSSFSRPFLTGVLSFSVWVLGRSADQMQTMKSRVLTEWLKSLLHGLARCVPNFHLYVPGRTALEGYETNLPGLVGYAGNALGYSALFGAFLLGLSFFFFEKRDLL